MKLIVMFSFLLACGVARGGEIYGRLIKDSKPVGNATVTVSVGSEKVQATSDEKTGSYRVRVNAKGSGSITVEFEGEKLKADVVSYSDSVRYDFQIVPGEKGKKDKYELKRK